ncbi:MAG TPA: CxxxxCH/CxxCH domain-containing protein [Geobacter sp.]|nr:CxxxxCH/CxxCH domain-containing protein [Geobacter sp.]
MKKFAIHVAFAALTILLLDHRPVQAVPAPHDSQCLQCHVSHNMLGTQNNDLVCFSCHNPSGGARAQSTPFSAEDAAHPYTSGAGLQSSHNWTGSDTNAQAGAQPPLDPALALAQHEGKMSCAKCHNLHGAKESDTNSAPFLRTLNDRDQMCLDCHRSRNTQSHAAGTHPVQVGYTSAVKRNPAGFYAAPRSANPANPTASMKLVKGQVSCSTCHGIHYTDSNAATMDNHSSALLGILTPSAGNLLRTDLKGAQANDVNLCTNCHQGKTAHNAGGQNVQCSDCHGAHVAETDGSTPNVWLLRRYMTYSTATGKVDNRTLGIPTYFQSTASRNYRDANGTGVCQSCHTLPATVAEHSQPDVNCAICHYHNNAAGAFTPASGSCTACHGQPPTANVAGGPDGYASGYTGVNEELSAHGSHAGVYAYSCADCHKGNQHAGGSFQDVFVTPAGTTAASNGATPAYDQVARTCSAVYCHSNGAPRGGVAKYATMAFEGGKGTLVGKPFECAACHGAATGSFNNMSTNAHFRHASVDAATGKQYGCAVCHAATVTGNGAIASHAKHANGQKELSFSGTLASGTSSDGATCSTSYCHSNGKGVYAAVSWTNRQSGACGSCHAATPAIGGALIATGAHFAHFSSSANSYGPMFSQSSAASCQACHVYSGELAATHVDKSIDINAALGFSAAGTGTCTPCHNQPVNWSGGAVTCQSCHTGALSVIGGVTAPDKGLAATRGHGRSGNDCLTCHDRNQRHINGGTRLIASLTGSLNTECGYCHNDEARVGTRYAGMITHFTVKGGSADMACAVCHDPHGTSNLSMIRGTINDHAVVYSDSSTGFVDLGTNLGLCQVCHTLTAHYRAGVPETDHPTKDCLNCHSHTNLDGGFKPKGGCDACHGYPPAPRVTGSVVTWGTQGNWSSARLENYSGGGGAHLVAAHIKKDAKPSEGWANCAICHNAGDTESTPYHQMALPLSSHVSDVTVEVDPRFRFDNSFTIYTGSKRVNPPQVNNTGSCFNISCHMSPSPRWSIER